MLIHVLGAKCTGIDAVRVTVEINITQGIGIHLVGLADTAVKESLLRTTTALQALGFHIPGKKIVINLAPADLHKTGSGYDLPIAAGIIAASEQMGLRAIGDYMMMGELGLNGEVRNVTGALPVAELSKKEGLKGCILPVESALEAVELRDTDIYGVRDFRDVLRILAEPEKSDDLLIWNMEEYCSVQRAKLEEEQQCLEDFADIIGQDGAKRGIEIAAAGNHNVIMVGPPGSGKSSLAKAMAGILPEMTLEESIVTSKIYSIAGKGDLRRGLVRQRPFRSPHYNASLAAIIGGGGGENLIPGEISLAQNGILFLDEFGQMSKTVIEALRAPMEDRKVTISRLRSKVEYPASFMMVAASNPCPCGYFGEKDRCNCTPTQRSNYLNRLSGPILDRMDIHLWLHPVPSGDISRKQKAESSGSVAERVAAARRIQEERFRDEAIFTNAEMNNKLIEKYCPLTISCQRALAQMMNRMGFSLRAYFRIIKVARTIADLAGRESIIESDLVEAAGFRFLDRQNILP